MDALDMRRVECPLCGGGSSRPARVVKGFALEKCNECGFVYMNPQPSEEATRQIYTVRDTGRLVELYSRIARAPSVRMEVREKLDWLEKLWPQKGRLLDFACASGFFLEEAQRRGWDAHGVDLGEWALEAATARGVRNLHVGDLLDLGFEAGSFDVVYVAQALEHLPRPSRELRELLRILEPGGLFYADVPNYRTLSIMLRRDEFLLNSPPQHVNYFTPRTLDRLLRQCGFEEVRTTSGGGMNWENLVGRPVKSEIADAYRPGAGAVVDEDGAKDGRPRQRLKKALLEALVRPVLYERCRLGITLIATARSPRRCS